MYKLRSRGFTLIELLVVIAIIGILSAVVLASLNTARSKGSDAAAISDLDGSRVQAELFYGANGNSYGSGGGVTDVCGTNGLVAGVNGIFNQLSGASTAEGLGGASGVDNTFTSLQTSSKVECHSNGTAYAAETPLKNGTKSYYCIDSAGNAYQTNTALGASAPACTLS